MSALNSRTALASAIALSASFGAQANEPIALGDVVVSASGFEQKITEAPASISVISREELQQKRYNKLSPEQAPPPSWRHLRRFGVMSRVDRFNRRNHDCHVALRPGCDCAPGPAAVTHAEAVGARNCLRWDGPGRAGPNIVSGERPVARLFVAAPSIYSSAVGRCGACTPAGRRRHSRGG